ncbi:uncharacterized protein [Chiloscyllium punctatum]|uniref:uncharacterized protein isoform X1 n=1 Tax=Chiloscyllium punctatum TaxID=137246 RepID=UPI003B640107
MVPVAEVIRTAGKAEQVRQLVPREIIWGPGDPPSEQDQVSETSRGGRQARAPRPGSCPRGEETVRQEFSCRPVPAPCHIFDITTQKWPYQFQCETPSSGQLLILGRREGGGNLFTCSNWSESKEGIYSANSGADGGHFIPGWSVMFVLPLQDQLYKIGSHAAGGGFVEVPDLKDGMQFLFRRLSKGFLYLRIFITPAFYQLYKANYVQLLQRIKQDLQQWKGLPLSRLGRIALNKMYVLPRLLYPLRMLPLLLPT